MKSLLDLFKPLGQTRDFEAYAQHLTGPGSEERRTDFYDRFAAFARVLDVDVGTLRNWEQGRREPTGPARALLRAIRNDPKHVLAALI